MTHGGNGDAVVEGFLEERHEGGRRLRPVPCPPHTGNVYALSALFATTDPLPCSTPCMFMYLRRVPTENVFSCLPSAATFAFARISVKFSRSIDNNNNEVLKEIYDENENLFLDNLIIRQFFFFFSRTRKLTFRWMEAINFGESLVSLTFSYEYSRRRDLCSEISGFLVRLMYGILGNEINNLFETPSGYTSNYKPYTKYCKEIYKRKSWIQTDIPEKREIREI